MKRCIILSLVLIIAAWLSIEEGFAWRCGWSWRWRRRWPRWGWWDARRWRGRRWGGFRGGGGVPGGFSGAAGVRPAGAPPVGRPVGGRSMGCAGTLGVAPAVGRGPSFSSSGRCRRGSPWRRRRRGRASIAPARNSPPHRRWCGCRCGLRQRYDLELAPVNDRRSAVEARDPELAPGSCRPLAWVEARDQELALAERPKAAGPVFSRRRIGCRTAAGHFARSRERNRFGEWESGTEPAGDARRSRRQPAGSHGRW